MSYSQRALLIKDGNRVHRSRQDPGHNVKMWFLPKPPRGMPRALNPYYHGVVARGRNVVCDHRPSTRKRYLWITAHGSTARFGANIGTRVAEEYLILQGCN